MNIVPIDKNELNSFGSQHGVCLAFLACAIDTPEEIDGFLNGFASFLHECGATKDNKQTADELFAEVRSCKVKQENGTYRTDLFYGLINGSFNMSKLAIARMRLANELKWLDDYLNNGLIYDCE